MKRSPIRSVIVFSTAPRVLTFHEWGSWGRVELGDGWHRSEARTACGILLDANEWRDTHAPPWAEHRLEHHRCFITLRLDHAQQIGELCVRCARTDRC